MRSVCLLAVLFPLAVWPQESHGRLVTDPAIVDYVNRIAQKIAVHAQTRFPVTVKVREGDEPHALTLPDGSSYLNIGLIRTAATEAELAAAIAHQIGHIVIGMDAHVPSANPPAEWSGLCLRGVFQPVVPPGQRDSESAADELALQYLAESGYDPVALLDLATGIQRHSLSARPFTPGAVSPLDAWDRVAPRLKMQGSFIVNTSEFRDMERRLASH